MPPSADPQTIVIVTRNFEKDTLENSGDPDQLETRSSVNAWYYPMRLLHTSLRWYGAYKGCQMDSSGAYP